MVQANRSSPWGEDYTNAIARIENNLKMQYCVGGSHR